jgi:UDP-N-acetylglucosamine--N-acetylmuramyl-(pentapeptide) pyrophosphoryl-undecaprenol N-acetylglucosamine transferase
MANRWLARLAQRVYCAFPQALPQGVWVGNPLRAEFLRQAPPEQRFAARSGPLRVLVIGGSLGAQALNDIVPQALALIEPNQRPQVLHQSGARQIEALRASYAQAGVEAELTPFIEDTASAYAQADLVICRAGASTVTELAAVGAAAIFVPFPHAVDDHQTHNARFLTQRDAGWLWPQHELDPQALAQRLRELDRQTLQRVASQAHACRQTDAVASMVQACAEVAA